MSNERWLQRSAAHCIWSPLRAAGMAVAVSSRPFKWHDARRFEAMASCEVEREGGGKIEGGEWRMVRGRGEACQANGVKHGWRAARVPGVPHRTGAREERRDTTESVAGRTERDAL